MTLHNLHSLNNVLPRLYARTKIKKILLLSRVRRTKQDYADYADYALWESR